MPGKSTLLPLGVLAGVLAVSGGAAVLAHGSGGDAPAAASPVATRPTAQPSPGLPPELVAAARTTLGHRSLRLTPGSSQGGWGGSSDQLVTGELDVASGNWRMRTEGSAGAAVGEMRYVGGVSYIRSGNPFSAEADVVVESAPTKPWVSMRVDEAERPGSDPVLALRLVRDGDPHWAVRSVRPVTGGTRYSLARTTSTSPGVVDEIDLDVRAGEVVQMTVRTQLPGLPTCPGVPKEVLEQYQDVADGDSVSISGSDQSISVTAPPADQVEVLPAGVPGIVATPEPLTCADLPSSSLTAPPAIPSPAAAAVPR